LDRCTADRICGRARGRKERKVKHRLEKTADSNQGVIWTCRNCGLRVLFPRGWPDGMEGGMYRGKGYVCAHAADGCDKKRAYALANPKDCKTELVRDIQHS